MFRHLTKLGEGESSGEIGDRRPSRCSWCGRPIDQPRTGRPRKYCRAGCRQQDYEARRRSYEAGLSEAELIITRRRLDELQDQLFVLRCAVEDVDRDLPRSRTLKEHREAIDWLLDAARPLVAVDLDLTAKE